MTSGSGRTNGGIAWLLFVLLLLLLFLPNLIWVSVDHEGVWIRALLVPAVLVVLFLAAFGTRLWLACALLAPFALLAPLEALYILRFKSPSNAAVLATLFASNPREVREYLGGLLIPVCLITIFAIGLTIAAVWVVRGASLGWQHRSRKMVFAILMGTPALIVVLAMLTSNAEVLARMRQRTPELLLEIVSDGYPFGLLTRIAEYHQQWQLVRENAASIEAFRFGASQLATPKERQIYVLVIGESSNREHWQMFGYGRPTNPELTGTKNLVLIADMLSPWVASVYAIPQLLTRRPINEDKKPWNEGSIVRAMGEAGFETFWISNQLPLSRLDSNVAAYANEARHQQFLNHASWTSPGELDDDLIEPLRRALSSPARNLFIVLHTMGSHTSYDFRYPVEFKRFQPVISDSKAAVPDVNSVVNSYDNTILYTDHVLARIVATLRESGEISALWFQSDHGEVVPNETCSSSGRGMGSRYEYQVPALFWYSDGYAAAFPDRVTTLEANAHNRALSADLFESLVDMTGVTFPTHADTHSLFSRNWEYRPRLVNYSGGTDFDRATFARTCEIILPAK